jgi:hypothetical protein
VTKAFLPFACKRCGRYYGQDNFVFNSGASNVTFVDNWAACPNCGTMNRQALANGTYNARGGGRWEVARQAARDILSAKPTTEDIERLAQLIKEAQARKSEVEQVASAIEDETPFAALAKTLRNHPPGWGAYLISTLLAVVLWLIQSPTSGSSAPQPVPAAHQMSPQQMDELAQKIANQIEQREGLNQRHELRKPGRNEPCFCGSGKKYKKCCGDPVKRTSRQTDNLAS